MTLDNELNQNIQWATCDVYSKVEYMVSMSYHKVARKDISCYFDLVLLRKNIIVVDKLSQKESHLNGFYIEFEG